LERERKRSLRSWRWFRTQETESQRDKERGGAWLGAARLGKSKAGISAGRGLSKAGIMKPIAVIQVPARRILPVKLASEYLGLSSSSVHNLIRNGSLPAVRLRRRVFVHLSELDKFVSELPTWTPGSRSVGVRPDRKEA
jgi:excisionase family DNA binding protein